MTAAQTWFIDQWGEELARTLQSMTDARPTVACDELRPEEAEEAVAVLTGDASITAVTFTFGAGAILWLALPEAALDALGRRTLVAAGIEDAGAEEIRNTCSEIVQQAHAGLAQAISRRVQYGVTSKGQETATFPTDNSIFRLDLSFPEAPSVLAYFTFSPGLMEAFEEASPQAAAKPNESRAASKEPSVPAIPTSKTFEVLLEVSMPVSVSFGRTEMLIKEVLKLTTGSIVELNRNVTAPVDVIVNDRVIARGEVVVVDGNYGVRIQQIVSLQERLRTSTQGAAQLPGKAELTPG